MNKIDWVCQECYDKFIKDGECFAINNITKKPCVICAEKVGVHCTRIPADTGGPDSILGFPVIVVDNLPSFSADDIEFGPPLISRNDDA